MTRALLVLAIAIGTTSVQGAQVSGHGRAIDSTIIEINGQRVMLFGVDSVMRKQVCTLDGKPWQCWSAAVSDLQGLLDAGPVTCDTVGEPDIYGRLLGRCTADGKSVNEQLVEHGFAVARRTDTMDYAAAETTAKERKVGLWQGRFAEPSAFRRASGVRTDRP